MTDNPEENAHRLSDEDIALIRNDDTGTVVWGDEKERECSLCGATFKGMGNNPEPLATFEERCCGTCNAEKVIPARLGKMAGGWD
jgi:hypothetical protein